MTKIGYEGVAGSHSEHAIQQLFESQPAWKEAAAGQPQGLPTVAAVLEAVEKGSIQFGLVPIENSIAGSFFPVVDQIIAHGVSIVGEFEHEEVQVLAALPGVRLDQIEEVHSHPYAFDQCRPFLSSPDLAGKKLVQSLDTAGSCQMIQSTKSRHLAAIASSRAASLYGLDVLSEIASEKSVTRFVLVAKAPVIPERHFNPRTSLQIVLKNQVGALMKAVSCFALRDISISKIESRPSSRSIKLQKAWEYVVYMDLDLGISDPRFQKALDHLQEFASVKVLGSYPRYQQPPEPAVYSYGV
ncbi:hypothetical protein HDV03_002602 [Kappamyces sp. JEL0829]|nr:hypothetical protein HDV03_002602 [Kappamyces sp. JEL0829]